ncbi:MAG TPA: hypothetical protein VK533_02140 [Sphingomonas sp.]|uniref:hypothetical protein n=1 Tax=Sphingomonas sp. TaxID=28214 RepID=UPI002BA6A239|nr:hypothetical protein [Sphingomonas sp.]HMI18325.1 hypothetical protein [Sphingomonas sp.]
MDRPREIAWFETLGLIALVLNIVSSWSHGLYLSGSIIGAVLGGGIILWIARGRSRIGRIVLTAWYGLGLAIILVGGAVVLSRKDGPVFALSELGISMIVPALNIVALVLLWSKPSTLWLKTGSRTG